MTDEEIILQYGTRMEDLKKAAQNANDLALQYKADVDRYRAASDIAQARIRELERDLDLLSRQLAEAQQAIGVLEEQNVD